MNANYAMNSRSITHRSAQWFSLREGTWVFAGLIVAMSAFGCGNNPNTSNNPSGDGDGDDPGETGGNSGTGGSPEPGACTGCNNGCCDGDTCIPFSAQIAAQCGSDGLSCVACEFGEKCS